MVVVTVPDHVPFLAGTTPVYGKREVWRGAGRVTYGMDYGFSTVSCTLVPLEVGRDKVFIRSTLEPLDLGQWLDLGPRGLRLIPHDLAFPPTYFNPDGTVDLVNKNLYLDDVMTHMERIAAALGCELEWDF